MHKTEHAQEKNKVSSITLAPFQRGPESSRYLLPLDSAGVVKNSGKGIF